MCHAFFNDAQLRFWKDESREAAFRANNQSGENEEWAFIHAFE
jgi:hypothetical protein